MNPITTTQTFRANEIIFSEGDPPGALYIIQSGKVAISTGGAEVRTHLAERKEGDVFGEMALVDNQPRSATATAVTDVVVEVMNEEVFSRYINELNPMIHKVFTSGDDHPRDE